LILEYLPKSLRVGKVPELKAMKLAARWIGRFHAANQERAAGASFLTVYDATYYAGWPQRAARFGDHLRQRFPWLATLCRRLKNEIATLVTLPQTIIHGEYYPHNVMFQAGEVRPVDWETAAIAPGEIDLATLGDGWPPHVIRHLEMEYQRARWPEGPPANFQCNLDLARIYMHLRWLGDLQEWGCDVHRWKSLHAVSKRLQLI
jgi:aminoglycoside phosphotransferase (APT) family kinase protein